MSSDDKTRFLPEAGRVTIGTQLSGIYELDEHLASGGMGEVYRGHNIQTGDLVAIKIVLPEFSRDQTILSLFRKEASVLNHLSHDAVVRYHVFTIDPGIGRPYLAMEFVNGESLHDVIRRGPMPTEQVRRLCLRLADGLSAVHGANTFHRDLSPDNIILPSGRVERAKIIDFGIARSAKIGDGTLIGGRFAGKYNYVSPEQLGLYGGEVSEQSDIYSLGLVLAAALRGAPIDMAGSQSEVVDKRRMLPDLSGIDESLRPLLVSMLQPDPKNRPASMAEIVEIARIGLSGSQTPSPALWGGEADTRQLHQIPVSHQPSIESRLPGMPSPSPQSRSAGSPEPWDPARASPRNFVPHAPPALRGQPPPATANGAPIDRTRSKSTRVLIIAGLAAIALIAGAGGYFGGLFDPTPPPDISDPAPAEPPVAEAPEETDVLSQADSAQAPVSGREAADKPSADTGPPPPEQLQTEKEIVEQPAEQKAAVPEEEVPGPDEDVAVLDPARQAPAAEALDGVAERISWLRNYPGGDCFYAIATSAADTAIEIEGFGTTVEPFMEMLTDFQAKFGFEPEIGVRLIEPAQCVITDFMRGLGGAAEAPQLTLDRTSVPSGSAVSGELEMPEGRSSNLLLIDHRGMVFNLDSRLIGAPNKASFSIPIGLSATDAAAGQAVPQVIVAVTSPDGIDAAEISKPRPAAEVFPGILSEIQARKLVSGATAKYFRLGG
ncbi:protein kinase [Mesorhizobium sp. WSM2239]|uniref:Protein kinase n=2 Tax=unclassified Mesorhizobium TaxID=325217 RepID=A0AAU8DH18_9HYPH